MPTRRCTSYWTTPDGKNYVGPSGPGVDPPVPPQVFYLFVPVPCHLVLARDPGLVHVC